MTNTRPLDAMIGRLDRLLSEFLCECERSDLDEPDRQTLKHHADDLVGVGNAALKRLGFGASTTSATLSDMQGYHGA